ncbi:MAG TPA: MFS transporter [Gemmatimonadaceae bacterium]|nr:MFS transporter [Gemmatimonadaceae bacterium]
MLGLLAVSELLGMSLWFAASAVALQLAPRFSITAQQAVWLTPVVQLGFVVGTAIAAVLNLADLIPARRYFAVAAIVGSAANASLVFTNSFGIALALRFATGFSLAGVYPPAMKMAATWFRARRGFAIGTVVGALTVGKATPYLVHALPDATPNAVILTASVCALIAAVLIAVAYHDGPYPFPPRPFSWGLIRTVFDRKEWRLATGGYLGHMFELYSFWTWIPLFLTESLVAGGMARGPATTSLASISAFGTIAVGGIGCVWGGLAADRWGRERLVILALIVSGSCALLMPLVFARSLWILGPLAWTWGFFVIADSAQFSALVTESVPPHAVGTALTIQTSLGFLLTSVSILLVNPVVSLVGWKWLFPVLAFGPVFGIAMTKRLLNLRRRDLLTV